MKLTIGYLNNPIVHLFHDPNTNKIKIEGNKRYLLNTLKEFHNPNQPLIETIRSLPRRLKSLVWAKTDE